MIEVAPEAVLELLHARNYYERARPGLGAVLGNPAVPILAPNHYRTYLERQAQP